LSVLASAADEPDYGLDINLWEDSPSIWGKAYNFGTLPFGNPALYFSTQAPFHMGFYHEDPIIYEAAPFVEKTFPMLRIHQYSTLATLAFRTGHPYWGWRFTGLAMHYVQDLTQPYLASLSPGNTSAKLIEISMLAETGFPQLKNEITVLVSNRHLALEKYQSQVMLKAAQARQNTTFDKSLRNFSKDMGYPAWSDAYARDVVSLEAQKFAEQLNDILVNAMPSQYVSDPGFDFGAHESDIDLVAILQDRDSAKLMDLNQALSQLMENFGAHSRNLLRGILRASTKP
jgi:hypothetical protein